MNGIDKVKENLLRRVAHRQGYELHKSPGRDPKGSHFGEYTLTNTETGTVYVDAAAGGAWLTAPAVSRALGMENLMTNGNPGHVSDRPVTVIPVIGLKLVPALDEEPTENGWIVESVDGGITATLAISYERAKDLRDKLNKHLAEHEQKKA